MSDNEKRRGRTWSAFTRRLLVAATMVGGGLTFVLNGPPSAAQETRPVPKALHDIAPTDGRQTAVFAGGCFWGVQAVFQHVAGVASVTSGYAGGSAATA